MFDEMLSPAVLTEDRVVSERAKERRKQELSFTNHQSESEFTVHIHRVPTFSLIVLVVLGNWDETD